MDLAKLDLLDLSGNYISAIRSGSFEGLTNELTILWVFFGMKGKTKRAGKRAGRCFCEVAVVGSARLLIIIAYAVHD